MQLESRKYLYDIREAARLMDEFVAGKTFEDYRCDAMLQAAVERKFEVTATFNLGVSKDKKTMDYHHDEKRHRNA